MAMTSFSTEIKVNVFNQLLMLIVRFVSGGSDVFSVMRFSVYLLLNFSPDGVNFLVKYISDSFGSSFTYFTYTGVFTGVLHLTPKTMMHNSCSLHSNSNLNYSFISFILNHVTGERENGCCERAVGFKKNSF